MTHQPRQAISIWEAMLLIAGAAIGMWLVRLLTKEQFLLDFNDWQDWCARTCSVFVGMSIVGVGMLAHARFKSRRRWRAGAICWLCHGLGSWLFVPMIVLDAFGFDNGHGYIAVAQIYFTYLLPIQSLVVFAGSIFAVRPARGWHRCRCWWPEWFGMWFGLSWAILGAAEIVALYCGLLV